MGESSLVARSPPIETSRRQAQRSRWHTHRAYSTQACSRAVQGLLRIVLSVGSSDLSIDSLDISSRIVLDLVPHPSILYSSAARKNFPSHP